MTETSPSYNTGVTDSGGAQPDAPGTWVNHFEAAYWQTQADQAQRELADCHAQAATDLRAQEQAHAALTEAQRELAYWQTQTQRVQAERDAALAQLRRVRLDVTAWAEVDQLRAQLHEAHAERDAALAQLDALKRQLAESEGRGRRRLTHDATQGMRGRRRA